MKTKCPSCNYEWNYKGKMNSICCPDCQRKFIKTPNNNATTTKSKEKSTHKQ